MKSGSTRIIAVLALCVAGLYFGCTKHNIKVEQDEPFRVDVNMRIDVYQHVVDYSNTIEDVVNEDTLQPQSYNFMKILVRFMPDFASDAYAGETNIITELSDKAREAIENRKARRNQLVPWQTRGVLGETADGMLEIVNDSNLTNAQKAQVKQLVNLENRDRLIIYKGIAQIEGVSAEEIGKVYSIRLRKDAPTGTPTQVYNQSSGVYEWISSK